MIKQKPDEIAKRNVTTFYYPDDKTADYLMKETAYRGKNIRGGEALFYHEGDDAHWLEHEAIKAITGVATIFTRLMSNLPIDRVIFHKNGGERAAVKEVKSAGFAINDYTGEHPILNWFDQTIENLYHLELLNKWMTEKGIEGNLTHIMTGLTLMINKKIHLLYREKREELVYPDKDAEKWPVDYSMKAPLSNYLEKEKDDPFKYSGLVLTIDEDGFLVTKDGEYYLKQE